MNILKVINNKKNVLLDDNQTCAFLKHRLTFSGTGDIPYIGAGATPNWGYRISQSTNQECYGFDHYIDDVIFAIESRALLLRLKRLARLVDDINSNIIPLITT